MLFKNEHSIGVSVSVVFTSATGLYYTEEHKFSQQIKSQPFRLLAFTAWGRCINVIKYLTVIISVFAAAATDVSDFLF